MSDGRVALLSVHPVYEAALVDGRKTVEFRKRRLAPDIRRVLVYATAPLQHVVGEFEVAETVEGTPAEIWARFGCAGLIGQPDFHAYYGGRRTAVAVVAVRPLRYAVPVTLTSWTLAPATPQSFSYLSAATVGDAGMVR